MNNVLNIISVLIILIGCKSQYITNYRILDLEWKIHAIEGMSSNYSVYIRPRLTDTSNNYVYDISYKIKDINRYPLGMVFIT